VGPAQCRQGRRWSTGSSAGGESGGGRNVSRAWTRGTGFSYDALWTGRRFRRAGHRGMGARRQGTAAAGGRARRRVAMRHPPTAVILVVDALVGATTRRTEAAAPAFWSARGSQSSWPPTRLDNEKGGGRRGRHCGPLGLGEPRTRIKRVCTARACVADLLDEVLAPRLPQVSEAAPRRLAVPPAGWRWFGTGPMSARGSLLNKTWAGDQRSGGPRGPPEPRLDPGGPRSSN